MKKMIYLFGKSRNRTLMMILCIILSYSINASALTIPDSIIVIEEEAFQNTYSFESLVIPKSVIRIGDRAFANCPKLKDITIDGTSITLGIDALGEGDSSKTITASEYSILKTYAALHSYTFKPIKSKVEELLEFAATMLGESYSIHDCVTYVYLCFQQIGVKTYQTCASLQKNTNGTYVSKISDLQPGDIICWKNDTESQCTHVGIYVGAGTVGGKNYSSGVFIESSRGAGKVRYNYIPATGTSYYVRNFMNAWRIL